MHACLYVPMYIHIQKNVRPYGKQKDQEELKPINKIIASPRASLCITLRAEEPAHSSSETHSSRAETTNHRELNKWSTRQAPNHPVHVAIRVLPRHFLMCLGFPGVLKEWEISSWCASHTQQRQLVWHRWEVGADFIMGFQSFTVFTGRMKCL